MTSNNIRSKKKVELSAILPLLNKNALFFFAWDLHKLKDDKKKQEAKIDLEQQFLWFNAYLKNIKLQGIIYDNIFDVYVFEDSILFINQDITWTFPRIKGKCIVDSVKDFNKIALQIVTLGNKVKEIYNKFEDEADYSKAFYFHGFTVWLTEALAEYNHKLLHKVLGRDKKLERYSFGYPLCPDLSMQKDLFNLLGMAEKDEVSLTSAFLMDPEQSTSGLII